VDGWSVSVSADSYVPEPPYCTFDSRVPASCVRRRRAAYPEAPCTHQPRAYRTVRRTVLYRRVPWQPRRAWLEVTLVDEAMGDDALDVALCEEVAARLARRQAVERLRLEEVMRAEVTKP
jgi:hypothetical protein